LSIVLPKNVFITSARGEAFIVNRVSLANTLKKRKIRSLSYFRRSVVLHTLGHSRTDQIKCVVSQLQPARRC
jgi:hypothetical protein